MATQSLIIGADDWLKAMGDSPDTGLGLVQNASIDAVPGTVMPNYATILNSFPSNQSSVGTFSGGVFTLNSPTTGLTTDGLAVTFATSGSLPTGITAGTIYFLYKNSSNSVIVASTVGNALSHSALSITGNGSGTITVTSVDMGTPNSIATGNITQLGQSITFVYDSNGRVWFSEGGNPSQTYLLIGNTTSNATGMGLALFTTSDVSKTYLLAYANGRIDVCDVTTQAFRRDPVGNSAWTNNWKILNSASGYAGSHQALLGQDNIVYACDSRYIVSVSEVAGKVFLPSDASTYSYNGKALTLPGNDTANKVEQLGINLLVGGLNTNFIYPWNRTDPSFGLPLICPEIGVYGMKNIGNIVYILNGLRGIIYSTVGYFVQAVKKIPEQILQSTSGASNLVTWGGVASKNGAFMFGMSALNSAAAGTYLLYPDGRLIQENTPSQGAALPTVYSQSTGEFYYTGYAGNLDYISGNRYSMLGSTVVQSRLYEIGTKTGKATFSVLEVQLDQPGASGGQVRVSYRTGLSGAFTTLATYTTDGSTTSFDSDIGLTDIQNIQIQVEVATNGTGSNATRAREVRLLAGSR